MTLGSSVFLNAIGPANGTRQSSAASGSTAPVSSFVRSRALRFWPRRIDRWIAYANSVIEE